MLKFFKFLASPMLMAVLIIAFAVSAAIATFIENDFGTQAARALVYDAWWFELVMLLLACNFVGSIFTRKLYSREKLAAMVFHVGFVIIILGAAVTRYFGQEGSMHIREGETVSWFSSTDRWLQVSINGDMVFEGKRNFTPATRNRFSDSYKVGELAFELKLIDFIPNAVESVVQDVSGHPVVSIMLVDSLGSQPALVQPDRNIPAGTNGIGFFKEGAPLDVALTISDSGVMAVSTSKVVVRAMSDESEREIEPNTWFKLNPKVFYSTNGFQFAYRGHLPLARVKMVYSPESQIQGRDLLAFTLTSSKGDDKILYVPIGGADDNFVYDDMSGVRVGVRYSSKRVNTPFGLKLKDFVLERYPGSESPSSFISHVQVVDGDVKEEFSIFMNNILNYKGYRFYQSSYDPDEAGTYLSVNKDFWGTAITYFGYFILIVGSLWALVSKGSRFSKLLSKSAPLALVALVTLLASPSFSQSIPPIDAKHAQDFGSLLAQDKGGRMKPIGTLAGEVLRKLNRSNSFQGMSPEQVYLGMSAFPDFWQHVPIVKIKNTDLKAMLGVRGEYAAFVDFFDHQAGSTYKLNRLVQDAFALKPAQRNAMQKEVVKVDEKVNVMYMVFSGQMARIFPVPLQPDDRWIAMSEADGMKDSPAIDSVANIYSSYILSVRDASRTGGWNRASEKLKVVGNYQQTVGTTIVPSSARVKAEVISNKLLAFERLIPAYGLTGLVLLIVVFIGMFRDSVFGRRVFYILSAILLVGFLFHTFAIGLRWFIAGRAPLSNGFESMVYVAWAAMLAGFMFARRNRVVLPATALLSTLTLFVAHLSWMDPEITNLVPVLKSYWLTIHVAVITASYGFLGLSAILGLFNLFLYSLKSAKNAELISYHISGITVINELSMTLGLYLLTIGSFLGAVWANESWGRYWGWDPKETWALITMLVYAFILHMRLIPSIKSHFAFNFSSLIGIGSVLMTYFGVNYYLSGLHSYAGGDPVPVPTWIYFVIAAILSLSFFAWYNNRLVDASGIEKRVD